MKLLNKYKSMSEPVKASLWYMICNFLQKGISFIVVPIYTRLLTTAEYGNYAVFQSWRDILIIFATLNLYAGVFTKAMVDYPDDRDRYTSVMQGLSTLITVIILGVYVIFRRPLDNLFEMSTPIMIGLFLYFIFYPAFSFWSVRQRCEYKYKAMVAVTLIVSFATPVVSLFLLFKTNLRENAVILGFLIVQIIAGAFFYIRAFIKCPHFYDKAYWKHGIDYNVPLIPHYLSLIVLNQSDRIMIKNICGSGDAGLYSLASQVSMIMTTIASAINGSYVPWSYECLRDKHYKELDNVTKTLILAFGLMTVGVIAVAPEVVLILGSRKYLPAIWVIPPIAIGVFYTCCYNSFASIEFYFSKTKYVMVASVVGAVLNIILNAIFIPTFGFVAAGYTTAVSYLVLALVHGLFAVRICKQEKLGTAVYDYKVIFLIGILFTVIAGLMTATYSFTIVRYGIIAVLIIALFINRQKVSSLLNKLKKK